MSMRYDGRVFLKYSAIQGVLLPLSKIYTLLSNNNNEKNILAQNFLFNPMALYSKLMIMFNCELSCSFAPTVSSTK